MAAATTMPIDLKSQATFPIRLGTSVLKSSEPAQQRCTSIRYNHKPNLKGRDSVNATIRAGRDVGESKLEVEDEDGKYAYTGTYRQNEDSYVLVIKGKECVLERLGDSHGFNLVKTPRESDAARLAEKYPPLRSEEDEEDDLFGDEDEDMPPDESNPFDYRHFLKAELDKPESTNSNLDANRSSAGTPVVKPKPAASATASKPAKKAETKAEPLKKRKAPAKEKANNPKRVKAGQEPAPATAAEPAKPAPKAKPEVPKINLDRKASLRRPSLDDSGELILENETPVTEKPPKHSAMALALQGQLGTGPISLRSAANSPGSHMASPAPPRPEGVEEEYVFEFDDDEPEPEPEENDEEEEDEDGDVENFELPSPAQNREGQREPPSAAPATGDDDDDLDKQLALAMMEEDDGGQHQQESEEESEEE